MKTIAVVGMSENPGGVETYLMNFFSVMHSSYKLVYINLNENLPLAHQQIITSQGGTVFVAQGKFSLKSYINRYKVALKILKEIKASAVYVNALTTNSAYWVKAAKKMHIPAVYHSHNAAELFKNPLKKVISNIIKPYNRIVLKYSVHLAASFESGKFMFGDSSSKVIYNTIDTETWRYNYKKRRSVRKSLDIKQNQKIIIMVSRLAEQKNVIRALNIVKEVVKKDPTYSCLLVGDGNLKEQVLKKINDLQLNRSVKLLGKRSDVSELMISSDILLLPSLFEGLPFVVIEAQGAGLPVVATQGVIPQIANVTASIHEVSLKKPDNYWADSIVSIPLKRNEEKLNMNDQISNSRFSMTFFNKQITKIFDSLWN